MTTSVKIAVMINAILAPSQNQISPVKELAIMAQMLWNPVNVPIAVAVSFLFVILEIHAFEIPSVAEAYTP